MTRIERGYMADNNELLELFAAAFGKPPQESVQFIEQACRNDPSLKESLTSFLGDVQQSVATEPSTLDVENGAESSPADKQAAEIDVSMKSIFLDLDTGDDPSVKLRPVEGVEDAKQLKRSTERYQVLNKHLHGILRTPRVSVPAA